MSIRIIHYHLNPGGVSKIIESQVRGIMLNSAAEDLHVLCGNANELKSINGTDIVADELLNYTTKETSLDQLKEISSGIVSFIRANSGRYSILHCHNPNLGKNPALTAAIYKLASEGVPVINHCHDFAEDRPENMRQLQRTIPALTSATLQQVLYPQFPRYHFIVLNSCDYERILKQGISASGIHLVPNPVKAGSPKQNVTKGELKNTLCRRLNLDPGLKLCTYPVRAIKRKNLGEFVLLAALFSGKAHFTVTQPPRNPDEIPRYNRWKSFCLDKGIPVKFEAGEMIDYEDLIYISDFCITTSIREGFGMVYLEPWLAGTPVIGRELSCILNDLRDQGIIYPRLYEQISVSTDRGMTDFKELDIDEQEDVIISVLTDPETRNLLLVNNPFLDSFLDNIPEEIITNNEQIIRQRFSTEEYGKRLLEIYRKVSW